MIPTTTLLAFIGASMIVLLTPGPGVLYVITRGAFQGRTAAVVSAAGLSVGALAHVAFAVIGLSALLVASATAFAIVKYLGAAYLVYLGIRAILEKPQTDLANGGAISITPKQAFRQAIIAEVLNPKSALFFVAFLPQFVDPSNGLVALQLTILGVLFVLMGLLSTLLVAITAGRFGLFLRRNPVILKWQGKVVGSIYCALGARLALQER